MVEQALGLSVSVIVPVRNGEQRLRRCLAALERQSYGSYEVVVIDDGSEPPVQDMSREFPHARVIRQATSGSYAARNRGLDAAAGQLVAFTDSDCEPHEDWLERAVAHFAHRAIPPLVLAGRIDRRDNVLGRKSLVERYDQLFFLRQDIFAVQRAFGVTANLVAPAYAFRVVGPFEGSLRSGGDVEWCRRAVSLGFVLIYADAVRIHHPTFQTLGALLSKVRRVAEGNIALQRGHMTFARQITEEFKGGFARWRRFRLECDCTSRRTQFGMALLIGWMQGVRVLQHFRASPSVTSLSRP